MDETEFHDRVTRSSPVDDPEPIAEATIETLGEALSSGQAEDVAGHLPEAYGEALVSSADGDDAGSLSREEFVERVEARLDERDGETGDRDEVRTHASAVANALQESLPRDERRGLRSQLPDDVESLFTDGPSGR